MRALIAGALIVVAGSASAAQAQSEPVAVPGRPPVVADPLRKIQIVAFAAEPYAWAPPPPEMIRRTRPDTDPATWLREADAPIAAWLANPALTNVTLVLQVGTEGTVTKCTTQAVNGAAPPAWAGDLCPLVASRAKLVPALKDDGSRMTDRFILNANFAFNPYTRNLPGPLISSNGLSPAPPPPSEFDAQLQAWPPNPRSLGIFGRPPAFQLAVEPPGGAPLAGPAIGLLIADARSGQPLCRVGQSSGDAKQDQGACDHVRKKLKPYWADTIRFPVRRWALLLGPDGKGFRAVQADPNVAGRAGLATGEPDRLAVLWRQVAGPVARVGVSGALGPDGRPGNCRVYDSSGNDAADVLACRLFRSEARFAPARDVFGRSLSLDGWVNMNLR